jgi:hypothetical protein
VVNLPARGVPPWFWYFLLRRIAEVRAAIAGNAVAVNSTLITSSGG